MPKKKTGRGGARPGAGRHPVPNPRQAVSLRVSPDIHAFLTAHTGKQGRLVEWCIRRSKIFRDWKADNLST